MHKRSFGRSFRFQRVFMGLCLALVIALVTSACRRDDDGDSEGELAISFVTVGPVADWGFNYSHNEARLFLEAKYGEEIKTRMVEKVPESEDLKRVIDRLVRDGDDLIFLTSFGYLDPGVEAAAQHEQVTFMHCGGYRLGENFGTYAANLDEPFFLSGMLAAGVSETKRLGFVGAQPIPFVYKHINAFALGARSVAPESIVYPVFTNSWNDTGSEVEAAESLLAGGCDVLAGHVDSPISYVQVAERRGAFSVGCHANLSDFAPRGWLTAPVWRWAPVYEKIVDSVQADSWQPEHLRGGIREGYVDIAPMGWVVPEELRAEVAASRDAFMKGERDVFVGPLYDQAGAVRLREGEVATREFKEAMDWFVEGVARLED